MNKYLWKFYWDCGRQGDVQGLFIATEDEIKSSIGKQVYFGEILGKHSEIYGTLDEGDVERINVEPDVIEKLIPHLGNCWSGHNPLNYIKCEGCGDSREWCSCVDENGNYIN